MRGFFCLILITLGDVAMAWDGIRNKTMILSGGSDCPDCKTERGLCLDGSISIAGSKIVRCHNASCQKSFCAYCGKEAAKDGGKYKCPQGCTSQ